MQIKKINKDPHKVRAGSAGRRQDRKKKKFLYPAAVSAILPTRFGWILVNFLFFLLIPFCLLAVPYSERRAPSGPFVTGDGFRAYCDYVYDEEDATLDPTAVQPGSAIFVKTDMVDLFFRDIHPRLAHPYVLVSHNSDHPAPGPNQALLDDPKLIAWFAQNVEGTHPKLHPIPIGIANRYWGHGNPEVLQNAIAKQKSKQHLLYFNFTIQNYHAERWPLFHLFGYAPFSYRPGKRRFDIYLDDLASSKFILAPRGNGLDTHRLWEALYLDSFPIVKTSPLDAVYDGLPVVVIQEWEDVTEAFLNQKYEEFTHSSFSLERRYLPYWLNLIAKAKAEAQVLDERRNFRVHKDV